MHLEELVGQHTIDSELDKLMGLVVTVNGCETTCLVDSGATNNLIYANLLETASL